MDREATERDDEARRGFAAMDPDKQRTIASKGGKTAHERGKAHEFDKDEAKTAGRAGGLRVSQNREHMAAIGRKGGKAVSGNREYMAAIGRRGGQTVSGDREHMASIGRKGGVARTKKPEPVAVEEGSGAGDEGDASSSRAA